MPEQSLSAIIARHVVAAKWDDLDAAAIRAGKTSLLDLAGVMLAATGLETCVQPFLELTRESGGTPTCTVVGQSFRAPPLTAAFANGSLAHAIDFDDGHDYAPVHPTAVCVPPMMAIAEDSGCNGKEFLEALIIGSDLTCRLGLALTTGIDQFGWYPPPILGAFGATAACGKLLKLDEQQLVDAFSLVLSQATASAEILFSPRSDVRSIRDAFAAQAVLNSALLAQRGIKGFGAPFEGRGGFINNYTRGNFDEMVVLDQLGERFENRNLGYKIWPSCRGTHGYVQVALQLIAEHDIVADDIAEIRLSGHNFGQKLMEPTEQKLMPQNGVGAKFSLPFTMGTVFTKRAVVMEDFFDHRLDQPEVLALARRVSFEPASPAPRSMTSARVEVRLADGRSFAGATEHALGHPANPISQTQMRDKFLMCAGYAASPLPQNQLQALIDGVETVETFARASDLIACLGAKQDFQRA